MVTWLDPKNFSLDPRTGLFLPKFYLQTRPRQRPSELVRYMKVFVSGKDVYGTVSTIDDVVRILKTLDLRAALGWLSAINLSIEKKGILDSFFQETIAHNLFPSAETFGKVITLIKKNGFILVHSALIETLERLAVLFCEGSVTETKDVLAGIGEAILRCVDCLETTDDLGENFNKLIIKEKEKILREFAIRNFIVNNDDEVKFLVPRYLSLFRDLPAQFIGHPDYIDLQKLLEEETGISLNDFCACTLGLFAYWLSCGADADKPVFLKICSLFETTSISDATKNKFLAFSGISIDKAKQSFLDDLNSTSGIHYNRLSLIQKPLLIFEDAISCLSLDYFAHQIGDQLYWRCLEFLNKRDKKLGEKFLRFFGELFHNYIADIFNKYFGDRFQSRIHYQVGRRQYEIDGIVLYPDCLLLIEIKGTKLTYKTKTTGSYACFEKDLQKIITGPKGVKQLDTQVNHIRQSLLNDKFGIDLSKLPIYPILILPENFPNEPLLWDYYSSFIESKGLLSQKNVLPITFMDSEEAEMLGGLQDVGKTLRDILKKKSRKQIDCAWPLKNFLIQEKVPLKNQALLDMYKHELNSASVRLFGKTLDILP